MNVIFLVICHVSTLVANRTQPTFWRIPAGDNIQCPGKKPPNLIQVLQEHSWIWVPIFSFRTVALLWYKKKYFSNNKFQQKQWVCGRKLKTGTGITFYCRWFPLFPPTWCQLCANLITAHHLLLGSFVSFKTHLVVNVSSLKKKKRKKKRTVVKSLSCLFENVQSYWVQMRPHWKSALDFGQ